jgi:hypothetical protein
LPFKCNLQRYNEEDGFYGEDSEGFEAAADADAGGEKNTKKQAVGLCTLNQVDP